MGLWIGRPVDSIIKARNQDKIIEDRFPLGSIVRVKNYGHWAVVERYSYRDAFNACEVSGVHAHDYFGHTEDYSIESIEPWTEKKNPRNLFGAILCFFGWHDLEKDPARKGVMRSSYQQALVLCLRYGCRHSRYVWRENVAASWQFLPEIE